MNGTVMYQWPRWYKLAAQNKWEDAFAIYKSIHPKDTRTMEQWHEPQSRALLGMGWFGSNPPILNPETKDGTYSLEAARFAYTT